MTKDRELLKVIKRHEEFRAYLAQVPEDQVDLGIVMEPSDKADALFRKWAKANGFGEEDLPDKDELVDGGTLNEIKDKKGNRWPVPIKCGSVGCVQGWLEYSYLPLKGIKDTPWQFLAIEKYPTSMSDILFDSAVNEHEMTGRQEALLRLDLRIAELKAQAGLLK